MPNMLKSSVEDGVMGSLLNILNRIYRPFPYPISILVTYPWYPSAIPCSDILNLGVPDIMRDKVIVTDHVNSINCMKSIIILVNIRSISTVAA